MVLRDLLFHGAKSSKRPHSPRLSQNASSLSLLSPSSSKYSISTNEFAIGSDEELVNNQKKIIHHLLEVDKNVAKEFSELSEKIQYDVSFSKTLK